MISLSLETNKEFITFENEDIHQINCIFNLYFKLRYYNQKFITLIPKEIQSLSNNAEFDFDRWFTPFVKNWLSYLSNYNSDFISDSVLNDEFFFEHDSKYSKSIKDLFNLIITEFEMIKKLKWSDQIQYSLIFKRFLKVSCVI